MRYQKLELTTELRRVARGQKPRMPVDVLADWALGYVKGAIPPPPQIDEVQFLERLYRLPDIRSAS
jgi:hypothetical protein